MQEMVRKNNEARKFDLFLEVLQSSDCDLPIIIFFFQPKRNNKLTFISSSKQQSICNHSSPIANICSLAQENP